MKTTALFVEILIVGFLAVIWMGLTLAVGLERPLPVLPSDLSGPDPIGWSPH